MSMLSQKTFSIKRITNGKTLNFTLQINRALTQIYEKDSKVYAPNFATTPLTITPFLSISGLTGNQINNVSNYRWSVTKEDGAAATQQLQNVGTTISKNLATNLTDCNSITIKCDAEYTEPITLIKTAVTASITVSKLVNNGAAIMAVPYAPDGDTFVNTTKTLRLHCDLWRGGQIDNTNVTYSWDMLVNGNFVAIGTSNANGISNYNTNEITVPASAITNIGVFRCNIKDTDTGSATYNTIARAITTLYDGTDPYEIAIFQPSGDGMVEGGTLPVWFKVMQKGVYVNEIAFLKAHTMRVSRYASNNQIDTTWGTAGYKPAPLDEAAQTYKINLTSADLLTTGVQTAYCAELN